jgi:pimeloyl-ACP methyl ester carboxylesterase
VETQTTAEEIIQNTMKRLLLLFFCSIPFLTNAQEVEWDTTRTKFWKKNQFEKIDILSSKDKTPQPSIYWKTKSDKPKPLLVYLHSWTADYRQIDNMALKAKELDWNYIAPNFRGPGWNPQSCGSDLVISDIDDAIEYMIQNAKVDKNEVHIYGRSAGGHATMLCYMRLKYPAKSFSSWAGISNFEDWYYETGTRKLPQHKQLMMATGDTIKPNFDEMRKRSPYFYKTPKNRQNAKLYLYAGIHDGYVGSVTVTQNINFYNKLVQENYPKDKPALVPDSDIIELLTKRSYLAKNPNLNNIINGRLVHYHREKENLKLVIFEGGHEMFAETVLEDIFKDSKIK